MGTSVGSREIHRVEPVRPSFDRFSRETRGSVSRGKNEADPRVGRWFIITACLRLRFTCFLFCSQTARQLVFLLSFFTCLRLYFFFFCLLRLSITAGICRCICVALYVGVRVYRISCHLYEMVLCARVCPATCVSAMCRVSGIDTSFRRCVDQNIHVKDGVIRVVSYVFFSIFF